MVKKKTVLKQQQKQPKKVARRGKAFTAGQKEIIATAFASKQSPRQIIKEHPHQGFDLNALKSMAKKHKKNGSLDRKLGTGKKRKRTTQQIKKVEKAFEKEPNLSHKQVADMVGINKMRVRRIMKDDLGLKTYKTVKAQALKANHQMKRKEACSKWRNQMAAGELQYRDIFFTDEKMFVWGSDGVKCGQNQRVHVPASVSKREIPAEYLVRGEGSSQGGIRCMVSCGISYRGKGALRIVEPGVKINAVSYMEMLTNTYEQDMLRIFRPHEEGGHPAYTFMQDNAPAHSAKVVTEYIKDNFPSSLSWPAVSPDLNPCDYWLWGAMEPRVADKLKKIPKTLANLKHAINEVYDEIEMSEAKKAIKQWKKRVQICDEQNGSYVETHLGGK